MIKQLGYIERSAKLLREAPPKRKSVRTKEQLKLAAARVLDRLGYHPVRIVDITERAGVSEAAFYTYFKDKREITLTVLTDVLHVLSSLRYSDSEDSGSPFDAIRRARLFWFRAQRANAGLVRCILQFGDHDAEFAHLWRAKNRELLERVATELIQRYPDNAIDPDILLLAVYALAAMQDELMRLIASGDDPAFLDLVARLAPTDEQLAEMVAVIWHRTLFPGLPIVDTLNDTAAALTLLDNVSTRSPIVATVTDELSSGRRRAAPGSSGTRES